MDIKGTLFNLLMKGLGREVNSTATFYRLRAFNGCDEIFDDVKGL